MHTSLSGQKAIVTGASRGIGRAVAIALAKEGCDVALIARNTEQLERTAEMCRAERKGVNATIVQCDVSKGRAAIEEAVEKCIAALGGSLSILVNNAGIGSKGPADEADLDEWERCIATNLTAPMIFTRLCLPHIKKAQVQSGQSKAVLFVASIASLMSMKGSGAYCASKHGIKGFAGCVFEDVREHCIKVCSVMPGYVNTDLVQSSKLDSSKMIQPEQIADMFVQVLQWPQNACPVEIVVRPQFPPEKKEA
jgi:3-oxoacyl-[acyl-carrier protein] reductase